MNGISVIELPRLTLATLLCGRGAMEAPDVEDPETDTEEAQAWQSLCESTPAEETR